MPRAKPPAPPADPDQLVVPRETLDDAAEICEVRDDRRPSFDIAVARAVAGYPYLVEQLDKTPRAANFRAGLNPLLRSAEEFRKQLRSLDPTSRSFLDCVGFTDVDNLILFRFLEPLLAAREAIQQLENVEESRGTKGALPIVLLELLSIYDEYAETDLSPEWTDPDLKEEPPLREASIRGDFVRCVLDGSGIEYPVSRLERRLSDLERLAGSVHPARLAG